MKVWSVVDWKKALEYVRENRFCTGEQLKDKLNIIDGEHLLREVKNHLGIPKWQRGIVKRKRVSRQTL